MVKIGIFTRNIISFPLTITHHGDFNHIGTMVLDQDNNLRDITDDINNSTSASPHELIDKSDALIFISPDMNDVELLVRGLKNGKNILISDISSLEPGAVAKLMKIHYEAATVISVIPTQREEININAITEYLDQPVIIDLKYFFTSGDRKLINDTFSSVIKMIDLLFMVVHSNIRKIQPVRRVNSNAEISTRAARLEFENGLCANILTTNIASERSFNMDIYQAKSTLNLDIFNRRGNFTYASAEQSLIRSHTIDLSCGAPCQLEKKVMSFLDNINNDNRSGEELYEAWNILDLAKKIYDYPVK